MYLPYLRGKQFELLALRTFAQSNPDCDFIVPVVEPVKKSTKSLEQAFSVLWENRMRFAVILNPIDGDFKHPIDNDIIALCPSLNDKIGAWIPAYSYRDNAAKILAHSQEHGLKDLMIIFSKSIDLGDSDVYELITNEIVSFIMIYNGSRAIRSKIRKLGKAVISLDDCFKTRPKNSDYTNQDDEFFSDTFTYYQTEDLWGYSDFTTIGKDFIEGGMLPYAIAIHLTYQKSDEEINVHHFVSDSNFDQSNIKGKFIEAAQKIAPFYDTNQLVKTSAVEELIEKSASYDCYPGLGYLKKLSILNHLELIKRLSK